MLIEVVYRDSWRTCSSPSSASRPELRSRLPYALRELRRQLGGLDWTLDAAA